ncbi:hypothetical protein RB195_017580 [Necator americanus]|uniref:Uncharacterized protein n=1 Tax=Necator americanus TaxID=51031 RepID=A0ABR1C5W5_NECAM
MWYQFVDHVGMKNLDYVHLDDNYLYHKDGTDFDRNTEQKTGQSAEDDDNDDDDPLGAKKDVVNVHISSAFSNKQSFSCPLAKPLLHTGGTLADLSPEDIDIVAAMGDALPAGRGLWEVVDVEFRGASFPIGGDANIDGLITFPNILLEFNERLEGISHGMGRRDRMPDYQLNVAQSETETEDLPEQAVELVRRLHSLMSLHELRRKWTLVTIATGTEEFCNRCDTPSHSSIRRALGILRKGIPKAFVVLLGPVHVASSYKLDMNILGPRCPCLSSISKKKYRSIVLAWREVFVQVQGCPYFRTVQNMEHCTVLLESEYQRNHATTVRPVNGTVKIPHRVVVRNNLVEIIALVVFLCMISVSVLGTIFYCHGRKATIGRFEVVPEESSNVTR